MTKNNFYQNYLTDHLAGVHTGEDWSILLEIMRHLYLPHMPLDKQTSLLEIGCGKGNFLKILINEGYHNFLGVDIGLEQIEYCRKYITDQVLLINDLEAFLKGHPQSFGMIIMLDVLEHIPKFQLISLGNQIFNALEDGGKLLIKTLNLANPLGAYIFSSDLTHEVMFSEVSLQQWCKTLGFSIINFYPDDLPQKGMRRFLRRFGRSILHNLLCMQFNFDYVTPQPTIMTPDIILVAQK